MLDTIMGFLGNGLGGGVIGALGGLATSWVKYKSDKQSHVFKLEDKKLEQQYKLDMVKAETDATIAEVNANISRDQINTEGAIDLADIKARTKVARSSNEPYVNAGLVERMIFNSTWTRWFTAPLGVLIAGTHSVVDILRTLVRVIITYGSVGFSAYLLLYCFDLYKSMGTSISEEALLQIIMTLLKLMVFTASTAISFWFMDKSMSRKFQEAYK